MTWGRGPPFSISSINVIISLDVENATIWGSHLIFNPGWFNSIRLKGAKYLNATKKGCWNAGNNAVTLSPWEDGVWAQVVIGASYLELMKNDSTLSNPLKSMSLPKAF